jgi:hypothetical protein
MPPTHETAAGKMPAGDVTDAPTEVAFPRTV